MTVHFGLVMTEVGNGCELRIGSETFVIFDPGEARALADTLIAWAEGKLSADVPRGDESSEENDA